MQAISLFSNCGAGDIGYARAGFVFHVMAELDSRRLEVAQLNHTQALGVSGDLRTTWLQVVANYRAQHGNESPDLLAACPPCQGMSSARGARGREDDPDSGIRDERNLLVAVIAQVTFELRPRIVVVENVPAFLTRQIRDPQSGEPTSAAMWLIEKLQSGYAVFPFLTDLCDFNVPQARKRTFLTFIRLDEPGLDSLRNQHKAPYPIPSTAQDHGGRPITLSQALHDFALPNLDAANDVSAKDVMRPLHFVPVWDSRRYQVIASIPPNSGATAWQNKVCVNCNTIVENLEVASCPECGEPLPRPVVKRRNGRFGLIHGFRTSSYKRMKPDEPAATITTASGHMGSHTTIHPSQNRVLSPLECALLQTFPHEFNWGNALERWGHSNIRAMIGEAVPPAFTEQHGCILRAVLNNEPIDQAIPAADKRVTNASAKLSTQPRLLPDCK